MRTVMIYNALVNADKGFDLCTFAGEVKEHFATYAEADKARQKLGGYVRYWLAENYQPRA